MDWLPAPSQLPPTGPQTRQPSVRPQPAPPAGAGNQRIPAPRPGPAARRDAGASWDRPPDLAAALQRALAGDEEAFRVLYRDAQPRVLRYLQAMVGADAEDVASETWLHVARDLHTFSGDSDGFRGWVATIARHRATDHLRGLRRRPQPARVLPEDLESWAAGDDTEDRALELVSTDAAIALIARLPDDQAEAVLLRVVMGLDAATAGKVLGKRPGAVRTASYRGLRRLSAWLERAEDTGAGPSAPPREARPGPARRGGPR
jgi:RNA polymerase sigma-70 factor (ECF subfamily)